MKIGTKSVLFGVHCFFLHPWFVAAAWWKLYGFPFDPRLWVAFFVHDIGYFGMPNMDGPEGELHPFPGANLMRSFFGHKWGDFCLYHSRFLARAHNHPFSRLCVADKLSITITPWWIYLPLANLSGEIHEYMNDAKGAVSSEGGMTQEIKDGLVSNSQRQWLVSLQCHMESWVEEHKDGGEDTWTKKRHT